MEWTAEVSAGDWIRERLDPSPGAGMHAFVPRGYPAYARIFHPATRERPVGRPWPPLPSANHRAQWQAFEAEAPEIDVERVTWADTAAAFGREMHPWAQWHTIAVHDPSLPLGEGGPRDAAGWRYDEPTAGDLEPDVMARIAAVLSGHTRTPDDSFFAVWEGHGGLVGTNGYGPSHVLVAEAPPARHREFLAHSVRDRFNDVFRKPTWQAGVLSDDISRGPRLVLPGRGHLLFRGSVLELADPEWPRHAPWCDPDSAAAGLDGPSPSLVWPSDHAWVMATEVDGDTTVVGGDEALVQSLCADPAIEALPVKEGAEQGFGAGEVDA